MPFAMEKSKSKRWLQYQRSLPYSTEVQWVISDLPFVQNKVYQYQASNLDLLITPA